MRQVSWLLMWWFMYLLPGMSAFQQSPQVTTMAECTTMRDWAVAAASAVFDQAPTTAGKMIGPCQGKD